MKKTIIISHGDKGGAGKSFLAQAIASLLELNEQPFLVVEADANEVGGQPDVAPRFECSDYAEVVKAPISGDGETEDLISDLFELIQDSKAQYVVVNTPAGASEHLEKVGDLVGLACESLDYRLVVFYCLFQNEIALKQAESVLNGCLARHASEFLFVKNLYFGKWDKKPILGKFLPITIPVIHENVMQKLAYNQSLVYALQNFPIMQKLQLEQFFKHLSEQGVYEIIHEPAGEGSMI